MSKRRYPIEPKEWLDHLFDVREGNETKLIQQAADLYAVNQHGLLEKGLGIADILLSLSLDNETLASAIIYPALQAKEISLDSISEYLGEGSTKLLNDALQMQSLNKLQHLEKRNHHQLENLRKMLLAMVTDVRSVLIILAERLWQLRQAKQMELLSQQKLAKETLAIYSPLANRLGVWQLKWEIEDLCLRYLEPETYLRIAKGIAAKRDEREAYINQFIKRLNLCIAEAGIKHFQITGRVKHIYSIYKKMLRKNANLKQIYDMSALRVLVENIEDCYRVLALLQNNWQQIPEEFDDYISQPKANGYQSIHTVLVDPQQFFVEVQIRTYQMHQESELGVASHWRYKEGVLQPSNEESKIALLRQIIAWQKEVVNTGDSAELSGAEKINQTPKDLFAERIYVFTPLGDIIDLPQGATPLDFAYTIHSEVGHRCRGAKVNGNIVPLTYELSMGQRVEILTAKQANPSRDWVNPHLKFLKSPRNRAKVQHWFKVKDSMQNVVTGKELLEKELKRVAQPPLSQKTLVSENRTSSSQLMPNIQILGVNNLLTHIAQCCKPLPGDSVIGYVTRNRGVSIHRKNCSNAVSMTNDNDNRRIEVNWGEKHVVDYYTDLLIRVQDRPGLLRDMTTLLASEKINVSGLRTQKTKDEELVDIYMTIEIKDREQLIIALDHLKKLPNIIQVTRR